MKQLVKAIQQQLIAAAKSHHHTFFSSVIPGEQKIYGVKTPVLNQIAKQYKQYSFALAQALWKEGSLEERIIAIKILEKTGKANPVQLLQLFQELAGTVNNWAVCDGLGLQFLHPIRKTHAAEIFSIASKFNADKNAWKRRLSLVMVEWYTRLPEHHAAIKKLVSNLANDEDYYVKKAVSWINKNFEKNK